MITKNVPYRIQFLVNCLQIEKREGKLINIKVKMCPEMTLLGHLSYLFSCATLSVLRD